MASKIGKGLGLLALLAAGTLAVSVPGTGGQVALRHGQPAPEITGGPWINSQPLSFPALRSRVVLVEFWTYG